MKINKKPHSGAGTSEQAIEAATCELPSSQCNSTTTSPRGQILEYLGHDRRTAVTGRKLSEYTGFDIRTITQMIERERRAGVPIVADTMHGYWLENKSSEILGYARRLRRRAREIQRTAAAIEGSVRDT